MKRIVIIFLSFLLIVCSCDPEYVSYGCEYEFPLNVENLSRTMKRNDTIWINIDFDDRICLNKGVYENGEAKIEPAIEVYKDDFIDYSRPKIIADEKYIDLEGKAFYVKIIYEDGRYKSKVGLNFSDIGKYRIGLFDGSLRNMKEESHYIIGYFDVEDINYDLIDSTRTIEKDTDEKYYDYYFEVVE